MKYVEINNVDFEIKGRKEMFAYPRIATAGIYDCYDRPSARKVAIWSAWKNWFREVAVAGNTTHYIDFGICSYNCNIFCIEGVVEWQGKRYYLYITPSHNRAYEI